MNIELLALAAAELGELVDDVIFLGGATVGLWVTDPAVPPERPTKDVDGPAQETAARGGRRVRRAERTEEQIRKNVEAAAEAVRERWASVLGVVSGDAHDAATPARSPTRSR